MIGIIDYGMGNLRSVQKAFEHLGTPASICRSAVELDAVSAAVLPGVGAFRDAIAHLRDSGLDRAVIDFVGSGRPFLGICLGLQLLFDSSEEDGIHEGLGLVPGDIVRFAPEPGLKIPHMGWNSLQIVAETPLLTGLDSGDHVYFVHSYYVRPSNDVAAARTTHGSQTFVSIIAHENIFATQFHPEKSQRVGLTLLENFSKLARVGLPASSACH